MFEEIQTGGMGALMKYMNDPRVSSTTVVLQQYHSRVQVCSTDNLRVSFFRVANHVVLLGCSAFP